MSDLLPRCNWPNLGEPYGSALREAVEFILGAYPDATGIVASGTILRGAPDASSDLDLYVVHTASYRQRLQKYFRGVPAEIFVNPPGVIERYFRDESLSGQPMTAHMLATGFVVLSLDPTLEGLRAKARLCLENPPPLSSGLTVPRYMLATGFEDVLDVAHKDEATARMMLYEVMAHVLRQAFLASDRYIPRKKDLLRELSGLDAELAELAQQLYSDRPFADQLKAAERITEKVVGATGFFEWQSESEQTG